MNNDNILEIIRLELNKTEYYINNPINSIEELEDKTFLYDIFGEYDYELDRDSHRWWDELQVVNKIGDKYFMYNWAEANRDETVFDLGWDFDYNGIQEVEPYEETIVTTNWKVVNNET